jgi:hypothetical protein
MQPVIMAFGAVVVIAGMEPLVADAPAALADPSIGLAGSTPL